MLAEAAGPELEELNHHDRIKGDLELWDRFETKKYRGPSRSPLILGQTTATRFPEHLNILHESRAMRSRFPLALIAALPHMNVSSRFCFLQLSSDLAQAQRGGQKGTDDPSMEAEERGEGKWWQMFYKVQVSYAF